MTEWHEHNGGPQPVADDVWVETGQLYNGTHRNLAGWIRWDRKTLFRIINQHLIDAALKRGIELGLEAAMKIVWKDTRWMGADGPGIGEKLCLTLRNLNHDTIANEARSELVSTLGGESPIPKGHPKETLRVPT